MDELLAAVQNDLYAHEEIMESDGEAETAATTKNAVSATVVPAPNGSSSSSSSCPAAPRSRRMSSSARSSASMEPRSSQEDTATESTITPENNDDANAESTGEERDESPVAVMPRRSVRAKEAARAQLEQKKQAEKSLPAKIERRGRKPGYRPTKKTSCVTTQVSPPIAGPSRASRASCDTATTVREDPTAKKMRGIAARRAAMRAAAREVYDAYRMGDRRLAPMKRSASRRTNVFKRVVPRKSPAVGPSVKTKQKVWNKTTMYTVGDIISTRDEENGQLHFAQIRALLTDAYARNFAELVWLVPKPNVLNVDKFDPARFVHMDVDARWHPVECLNYVQSRPIYEDYWKEWTPAEALERQKQEERRHFILRILAAVEAIGDGEQSEEDEDGDEPEEEAEDVKQEDDSECLPSCSGVNSVIQNGFHTDVKKEEEEEAPMDIDGEEKKVLSSNSAPPNLLSASKTVPRIKPLLMPMTKSSPYLNNAVPSTSSPAKPTPTVIPRLTNAAVPKLTSVPRPNVPPSNGKPLFQPITRPSTVFGPIVTRRTSEPPQTRRSEKSQERVIADEQKKIIEVAEASAQDVAKKDKEWVLELMRRVETEVQQEPKKEPKKRTRRRKVEEAIRVKEEDEERMQGDLALGIASGRITVPVEYLVYPPYEERENGDPRRDA